MTSTRRLSLFAVFLIAAVSTGCATSIMLPDSGSSAGAQLLGPVSADSGRWPIALNAPPPTDQIQTALRRKAAEEYRVPEIRIVLTGIEMSVRAELDGTVRSWKAKGEAYAQK